MIIIENLTKKYKSKNRRTCTALDKVTLTLPDSGMIFIIGKSGSGKSTLLNMIGGLDNFDSGEIIAGGNNLAHFKNQDFYKYRASYVGFIFQDYHLIDELMFDGSAAIADSLGDATNGTIVLKKDTYVNRYGDVSTSSLYKVNEKDLDLIDQISGNQTREYLLYNYSSTVNLQNIPFMVELEQQFTYTFGKNHIYSPQMAGVLECDDDYLSRKFANGGEIKVLAGDIDASRNSSGIIITDYLADAMIVYNPLRFRSYDDVIGNHDKRAMIVAVIDTGYKERYADLIDLIGENTNLDTIGFEQLNQRDAAALLDDIKCNLAIGYSLNPDFYTAAVQENTKYYSRTANFEVSCFDKTVFLATGDAIADASGILKEGEIYISDRILTQMFPDKNLNEIAFPFTAHFKRYEFLNGEGELLGDFSFTVVGIASGATRFSTTDYLKMKAIDIIPYAIYVENYENANELIDTMSQHYFSWNSTEGTAVTLLNKSVNMFFNLFRLIEIMILAMTAVFLISHSIRSVRNNYYQIGVIKAIGGKNGDIARIFIMQNALLSIAISVLIYLGALFFVGIANNILLESFTSITNVNVGSITIIPFDPSLVMAAIIAAIALSLTSTIAPLILLSRIKPINIIKAKE